MRCALPVRPARWLREELGLEVGALQSGPLGGDQEIGGMISGGDIDFLIFFDSVR